MDPSQEGGGRTNVVARPFSRVRDRLLGGKSAQDQQLIAEWFEGGQNGREVGQRAIGGRRPTLHDDPVRHVRNSQSLVRLARRRSSERGYHAVQQGKRQRGAHASEE